MTVSSGSSTALDFARGPITREQLFEEAKRRFGDDPLDFAFRCPSCGDVATIREFPPDERARAGQECIGRTLGALSGPRGTYRGRGCDWCSFGLIPGPVSVELPGGRTMYGFPLVEAPDV